MDNLDLAELIRLATEGWRATAAAAKIEITTAFDGPLPIFGDPERLNQAFANLMGTR